MQFLALDIPGAYCIKTDPQTDNRGYFIRHYDADAFDELGLEKVDAQISVSHNNVRGTLRGLHFIPEETGEAKMVRCTQGSVYDVLVDLRPKSPTFGQYFATILKADAHNALYIPRGCAHGFITLEDLSDVTYYFSMAYRPGIELGVKWDDPDIAVDWPIAPVTLSNRDQSLPTLKSLNID